MKHFARGSRGRSVFSKRVSRKVATKGLEKSEQKRETDASRGVWAFVSAKFVAGGPGTFGIEGNGQKPKEKITNKDFGVSGVSGGPVPYWSL